MMLIGCHGSVWTGDFGPEGMREAVRRTKDAGFDLLEIPLMDPQAFDVASTNRLLIEHDLSVTTSLGLEPDIDISSEDPDVVAAGERHLRTCLEITAGISGAALVGVIHSAMGKHSRPVSPQSRQNSIDAIRRLAAYGRKLHVQLGLEVVNRYESNVLNTARQALEFLDEVGDSNACVHLDSYHMNIEESDMFTPVQKCGGRLGYLHVGESHRGYLGSGTVDFETLFRALASIRYDGPIVFESFSSAVVHDKLSNMLAVWRNPWDDPDELGSHANVFIRSHLRSVESIRLH